MSVKVQLQATIMEGWSDKAGRRMAWRSIEVALPAIPRVGDYFDSEAVHGRVETVFWNLDGSVAVRLASSYTGNDYKDGTMEENFDRRIAALDAEGWQ